MPPRRFPIGTILFLLFSLFTLMEIYVIIWMIRVTGLLFTIFWSIAMAFLGAALARQQGLAVVRQVFADLAAGRIPGRSLVDGVLILLGAALLITPGPITDIIGVSILLPPIRRLYVSLAVRWIKRHFRLVNAAAESGPGGFRFHAYTATNWSRPSDAKKMNASADPSPNPAASPRPSDNGDVIDAEFWEDD